MRIVATFGVWDLFHIGHLNLLERARGLGDRLVVGIATDELAESYKGYCPLICYKERERIVKALKCVDLTFPYSKLDLTEWLKSLDIDVLVVGGDWGKYGEEQRKYKKYMLERGKFITFPYTEGVSTLEIKQRILDRIYKGQRIK